MRQILEAVEKGKKDKARELIAIHPTDVLKETHEHQKLTNAVYLGAAVQVKMAAALSAYMSAATRLSSALDVKLSQSPDELAKMRPKEIVELGQKMARIIQPAIDIAMATVKRRTDDETKAGKITLNTFNLLVRAAHEADSESSDVSDMK